MSDKKPLCTDTHAPDESDKVVYNLMEDIRCLREDREALQAENERLIKELKALRAHLAIKESVIKFLAEDINDYRIDAASHD